MKKFVYIFLLVAILVSPLPNSLLLSNNNNVINAEEKPNILSTLELNEQKFRTEFGLDNKDITVKNTIEKYELGRYGVHLSPEEEEKLTARISFQEQINPKLTAMLEEKFGKDFILYIDQQNNGTYHIGIKQDVINEKVFDTSINLLFNEEYEYKIEYIKYSEQELDDLSNKIVDNYNYLEKQDIIINQVYTDVVNQRVNIGVKKVSDEKRKVLINLFGDNIYVHEAVENGNSNRATTSSTMKGGLRITYSKGTETKKCSVGFMVKPPNGVKFIVTAGHCYGTNYKQGTNSIGASMIYYKNSGNTDAGMVGGGPSAVDYTGGNIYSTSTKNDKYDKTQNASEDVVGDLVCMSGASSETNAVSCGTLNSKNLSVTIGSNTFTKLRKASYTSVGGDSGGTVYGGTTLKGVNKGFSGSDGMYSHLEYVMDDLATSYGGAVHILF